jgi:hypothetical protein
MGGNLPGAFWVPKLRLRRLLPCVLLAGALLLAARDQVYGYVWLTDGTHMVQGLAFAGGALLLLDGLERGDRRRLALSLACLAAGLLVREDTLAVVPVVLLLGAMVGYLLGFALLDAAFAFMNHPGMTLVAAALIVCVVAEVSVGILAVVAASERRRRAWPFARWPGTSSGR